MKKLFKLTFFVLMTLVLLACQPVSTVTNTPTPVPSVTPTPLPVEITDSKGFTMRLVLAGDFTMGSDAEMAGDAQPAHTVTLPDYYMDVYEVTRGGYQACLQAGVCSDALNVPSLESYFAEPNFPMSSLSWDAAKAYCEWRGARLPSEAEWEKAARGTDGRTYPWGEGYDLSYFQAEAGGAHAVGIYEKGKSPYGMYDMAGNGWEWTADPLTVYPGNQGDHSYYRETDRVLRGGSWDHPDQYVVSTWFRFASATSDTSGYIGFRCAKDATP